MVEAVSALDPALVQLAHRAEAGVVCPLLRVVVGGYIIIGEPVSTQEFRDVSFRGLYQAVEREMAPPDDRRRKNSSSAPSPEAVQVTAAALADTYTTSSTIISCLNLRSAFVIRAFGEEWCVPALRVPLVKVEAWWVMPVKVNTRQQEKVGSSGGGLSVGVVVPF